MNKRFATNLIRVSLITAMLFFATAGSVFAQVLGDTLLNVTYEDNSTTSAGTVATHATAADAAFMVQPGATGNWAIAHKLVYGDSAYYSDGSWRSESDAIALSAARHAPGMERRYEFSILLKDWTPWVSGPIHETNIFQLKISGNADTESGVPLQLRVARNALRLRYVNSSRLYNFLDDVRPYYNQWIHFRIDAKWTLDATGYIRTYMKLPGQSDFSMVDDSVNYNTFAGDPAIGNVGYIKWGLYGLQEGLTRVVHHDDVRIIALNPQNEIISIWSNPLQGPTGSTTGLSRSNPYTEGDVKNAHIAVSGIGFSPGTLAATGSNIDRYLVNGWNGSTTNDGTEYFSFTITPDAGYGIDLSTLNFGYTRTASSPTTYALRANIKPDGSVDGFTTDIASATVSATNSSAAIDLSAYKDISTPITFRLYWYGGGTAGVSITNFDFTGTVASNNVLPVSFGPISAVFKNDGLLVNWQSLSETHNSHFEIQASRDGQHFTSIKTITSKNGNSLLPQHYEATIAATDMAAMASVPLLLGFLGWGINRRRNKIILLSVSVVFTAVTFSCNKYNDALHSGRDKLFIRIKQVDLDGKANYSKVITVVNNN